MDGSGCMKENSKMQKREFLKGSLAALGVFGCGAAAARSEFPEARDIKWDETFDVVVVGSGIAATCAANESIDLGAKRVIMVDKMPVFGGNSAITGFWINVPRTPEQLAHGVKDDSPELFLKDTLKAGEYFNDPKLAHALCFKALESFEYIRKLGCEFAPTPFIQGGHSKIRSLAPKVSAGISVMLPLHRHFLKRGGIMRKNTIVDEIIKDETGRCVGVAVRENYVFDINSRDNDLTNKTGVRKYYRAEKGIVFGAGGGVLFIPSHLVAEVVDGAAKTHVKDDFGFEMIAQNKFTTAQIDKNTWTKDMLDLLMDFIEKDERAKDYRGLDWSVEYDLAIHGDPNDTQTAL